MATGLKIINNSGTVLIDSVSPAVALSSKQVVQSNNLTVPTISVANSTFPIMAINCTTGWTVGYSDWSGTTRRYYPHMVFNTSGARTVSAYVFDKPVVGPGSTSGLKVYDAAGNLTFDAMQKTGRVVGVLNGNGTFVGSAGRVYAGIITGNYYKDEIIVDPNDASYRYRNVYGTFMRNSGNNVVLETALISSIRYPSPQLPEVVAESGAGKGLVLDVTGY